MENSRGVPPSLPQFFRNPSLRKHPPFGPIAPVRYSGLCMEISIVTLGRRAVRNSPFDTLFADYCQRIRHTAACTAENYASEDKFLAAAERGLAGSGTSRARPALVLLDSRGRQFSSEQFADWIGRERDQGTQRLAFAVGPANGWTEAAIAALRQRAGLLLSLGPMTLPHELAAVVLAEQIYRAFTILGGHPYHLGHTRA